MRLAGRCRSDQTPTVFIRERTEEDLEAVAELRLRLLAEHRDVDPTRLPAESRAETVDFLRRHNESATSRSWLAEHGGNAVGVVTMLLLHLAPRPEDTSGVESCIINMYVAPARRRRGLRRRLLTACRREADQLDLRAE